MKKEQKDLCVPLRTRLIFQANNMELFRSTKKDKAMGMKKYGMIMAISMLVLSTLDKRKMGHFINYKRTAPMITT
jgi:hypothetical protein